MIKPEVEVVEHVVYGYMCPLCDEEYEDYDEAEECLDKCWKQHIEEEKERKRKEALAPLPGQLSFIR